MTEYLTKYLEYIDNTGGSPTTQQFDQDWEPIGPLVRRDLTGAGLIEQRDGKLYRTSQ